MLWVVVARSRPRGRFGRSISRRDRGPAAGRLGSAARGTGNLLPSMREALRARATLGEVSDVLRAVFGEYHPS